MDWLQFVASVVGSLAWPAVVVGLLLLFRKQVQDLLRPGALKRAKFGNWGEFEWYQVARQVSAGLQVQAPPSRITAAESATAQTNPRAAVLERYQELLAPLIDAVRTRLDVAPSEPVAELIDLAALHELIRPATRDALVGVTVLRNLAAHGPDDELDPAKAADFIALADATQFALDRDLRNAATG